MSQEQFHKKSEGVSTKEKNDKGRNQVAQPPQKDMAKKKGRQRRVPETMSPFWEVRAKRPPRGINLYRRARFAKAVRSRRQKRLKKPTSRRRLLRLISSSRF